MPYKNRRTGPSGKLLLAVVFFAIALIASGKGRSAPAASLNRCPTTITQSSVAYSCWSAYPEAFYVAGYARSPYRLSWQVRCIAAGAPVAGSKTAMGSFKVIVNQFTQPTAYQLMISNDVCKIDLLATRTAGNGSITIGLVINQNHAMPLHN